MKTKILLIALVLIVSACKDLRYHYYTRINDDGTIFKRIVAEGDSSKIYSNPFSFDINDGWSVSYDKKIDKNSEDTLFVVIVEKTFLNVTAVNKDLVPENDSVYKDNISLSINSKFRGFFTFHKYSETFKQRFPFKHLSVDDYLSSDEYAYFFEDDTSIVQNMSEADVEAFEEQGEEKFWDYLTSTLGIEFVQLTDELAHQSQKEGLTESDSLFVLQLFKSSVDDGPELVEICQLTDQQMNATWLSEAYADGYFEHFEKQIDDEVIMLDDNDYSAEIEIPGLLFATNANSIDNNSAKWSFCRGSFLYKDYTLTLEYRTINYWAFIIIAVLFIILVVSFIVKRRA
ncbi:hypothetical protein KDU71_19945 [Carboxylicivirga sediminis]|uniref:Uncharacterized protein n=1 Tax=Carboxylicivirga sediminis TaxID=2006564 RepID=A0A941J072_9BACT|nr:hypothetical protein [Carboxylicivirga sediminis]MBR8537854.1 hypothetical protein [Carboxylicivirga sediminis]